MDTYKSELGIHCVAPPERRREWRESRRVPVEVSGFDARGRFFTERTSTLDVSDSGCCFLVSAELEENSAVSIRVVRRRNGMMHDDPPVLFRIAWTRQTHPGWPKWTVAGEKLQPVQLWTVGFPVEQDGSGNNPPASTDHTPPAA
jgi:PilZ domain